MSEKLNIPETWELATLGEICSIVTDGTHKTPNYIDNGIPFISIANIRPFEPINFNKYVKYIAREEHIELCKRAKPEKDDILFPRIGTLGYAKRIDFDYEVSIFVGLGLAKPFKDFVNSKYLEFYMNTHWFNKFSFENATGTGRLTLPLEASRILPIPISPLPEQHRIVAKIEELFSSLDKGIESLKTAQQQLKVYRQAVLKWAFEGRLTNENIKERELPEGWRMFSIGKVVKTIDGDRGSNYPKKNEFFEKGYCLFLSTKNVREDRFVFEENIFISKEKDEILRGGKLQLNDVVITTRGTLGNVALYDDRVPFKNVRINSGMLILRVINPMLNDYYLMKFVSSPLFIKQLKEKQSGTAQPQIPANVLREIQLPIPPTLEEQKNIIAEIESHLSVCDKIEESIENSLKQSEALRRSILKRAFEGKIVPQDPTDEPAEKLLKRIREEKTKRESSNKKEKKHRSKNPKQMELI